jgi:ribosome-binding ATPase
LERIGLVGLPNSGKSSLFNALTGASVPVAPHPFTTTETTIGIAHVPDSRMDRLSQMSASKKTVYAGVEVSDIGGVVASSDGHEGLGNRMLAGIREVDALCLVVRSFVDDTVPGETDPVAGLESLEFELILGDVASLETQITRAKKASRVRAANSGAIEAMERAKALLETGVPLYRSSLPLSVREELEPMFLLTNKPTFVVVNRAESQLDDDSDVASVAQLLGEGGIALGVSIQLEAEASRLEASERAELLEGLGLGEGALARIARALFDAIGRWTFFTTGDKESRAWTFRAGAKAPECAGVIHSDLQRGFIRAEVIHWDELLDLGSWHAAKSSGKLRLEGKDYPVKDGDVLEIRFNV